MDNSIEARRSLKTGCSPVKGMRKPYPSAYRSYPIIIEIFFEFYLKNGVPLNSLLDKVEKDLLLRTLTRTNGNQRRAAEILGIKPSTMCEKLKRHRIVIRKEPD